MKFLKLGRCWAREATQNYELLDDGGVLKVCPSIGQILSMNPPSKVRSRQNYEEYVLASLDQQRKMKQNDCK